jgi:hypothetical protein
MNRYVGGAWGFITDSIINALKDKGHVVERYENGVDQWHRFDPDLYIGCSGHKQIIPSRRRAMLAIHVNPFGPVDLQSINESAESLEWVKDQKPDVVFGYGSQNDKIMWSYYNAKFGIPWVPMPTAGDRLIFQDLGKERNLDVVYLGGRWAYKAQTIDEYLLPILQNKQYKIGLRGWGGWPSNLNASSIDDKDVNGFLNCGVVGPCMSEIHTHKYGIDIPERAFKLALCGVCAIHDPVPSIRNMISSMVVASSKQDYQNLVDYYVKHFDEAREIAQIQRLEVLSAHTYHHRCSTLFEALGLTDDARKMLV